MQLPHMPECDFSLFIRAYFETCRERCGRIEALAGRSSTRDLVPGLSDFDGRFVAADDTSVEDWCRMSAAVGEAHLDLCRRLPRWARALEHPPGANLMWRELVSESLYWPEARQWTFCHTADPRKLDSARGVLLSRPWDAKDEAYHLRRFCLYHGRYDRTIDPPINVGAGRAKYPMHSRLLHYFAPAVNAAMCLLDRQHHAGKLDALELASARFPAMRCWEPVWEILDARYEAPRWYEEPRLTLLEDLLEEGLNDLAAAVREAVTLAPAEAGTDVRAWGRALDAAPPDPVSIIFDGVRFSRLMKGRLWFFANAPDGFESDGLIQNELGRIGRNFFAAPFRAFLRLKTGEVVEDPAAILDNLSGLLTAGEMTCTREYVRLTSRPCRAGGERQRALALVEVFDGFYSALSRISRAAGASCDSD